MINTVLFDLDGTLLDTAPDIARALERLCAEHGIAPPAYPAVRDRVSHGARAVLELAFTDVDEALRTRFLDFYAANIADETVLFDGMEQLLAAIEADGIRWGVVTNKPARLTVPLLAALGLDARVACVVSGDTLARCKPHPDPILHGCKLCGRPASETVYVGDAERDVQSARAAGAHTAVALFGYVGPDDRPQDWGADVLLDAPSDLIGWLDARRGRKRRA